MREAALRRGGANMPAADNTAGKKKIILVSGYDSIIFLTVMVLVIFGVVMIFSSSYYAAATNEKFKNDMFYFLVKQGQAVALGFIAFFVLANINYHNITGPIIYALYALANLLLIYVMRFGEVINGARRWIRTPLGSFQPSEFAKFVVILFVAYYLSKDPTRSKRWKGLLGWGLIIALPCALVVIGNNLSTALIIAAIGFCMLFVVTPRTWLMISAAGTAVAGLLGYLMTSEGFRGDRFAVWGNPFIDPLNTGFQTIQSLYAVASGGLFGLGLGQSHQKLIYMPEPYNDFIFAVVCEELGFVGATILLFLFGVLIWRGIVVALKAMDIYGSLIAFGSIVMISVQVIINVGVVTKVLPNTGIPMPFISYGGNSVIFIMALMGILLNISRYHKKTP